MRVRPIVLGGALALTLVGAVHRADGQSPTPGPHEGRGAAGSERELDVAGYWLPRHRAFLERAGVLRDSRRPARASAAPVVDAAARGVTRAVRLSGDILVPPPPASLPTAQAETQTEPHIAVNPFDPDNVLVGWQEQRFSDGGARTLNFAVSRDGGATWVEGILPGLTVAEAGTWDRASDPWVAFGPDGRAYYNSLLFNTRNGRNAIGVSVSEDGGATWGLPVEVFAHPVDFNDKNAMVVDTAPASRGLGTVYVAWDINDVRRGQFVAQDMVVSRSTDGGRSFKRRVSLQRGFTNIGIVPRVGPDGTVYTVWSCADATDNTLSLCFARSDDRGVNWSTPERLAALLAAGVPGYRAGAILASFDVDPVTGDLFVAWPDARFSGVDQVALSISRDGGATWSRPKRVSDGPARAPAFTVSVAANGAGDVAVSYYTLRHDPSRSAFVDHYVRISTNGGERFRKARRVTRRSFDARLAARAGGSPQNPNIFLGDYVGLAGGNRRFHMLWTATTEPSAVDATRMQPDIFTARTR